MIFDPVCFREAFPEFADIAKYTDASLCMWGEVAENQVSQRRWGNMAKTGVNLYVAHNVTLAGQNAQTGAIGGTPGQHSGPLNSKTVGSVTAAYDTQQGFEEGGGWWNLTSYGKQFYHLCRIFGSGALQV